LPSTEAYTALERGTVDATGWTEIGLMDANWDKLLKFRLDPPFFTTDLGVIINVRKWNSLSDKSKEILQKVMIEHEVSSMKDLRELRNREFAELEKRGVKGVSLGAAAAAKFGEEARNASYERMRERLAKLNPTASARLANRLIEASQRAYWTPDADMLRQLQQASDELEDRLEGVYEATQS
jgi:TRAP-type C4-dicarboxylate transport system substrate-binding protein